ncbi:MAG: OmpA family protein [Bacteroidales bacterium]|nr:OmpA family protein [Bacteroidales bacterium]
MVGQSLILEQISFDYNKSELLEASFSFFDELSDYLHQNPTVKIEINGFTDNTGKEENNKQLSLDRAKAVFEYLVQKGIAQNRMKYQGYGSQNPIADNSTEAGRQKKRRVEIRVVEK